MENQFKNVAMTTEEKIPEGMREYEVALLLKTEEEFGDVKKILSDMQARITFESPLARRELSYAVKGEARAYFGFFYALLDPKFLASVNRALGFRDGVLRFIIITPPIAKFKERKPAGVVRMPHRQSTFKPREQKTPDVPLSNEEIERKIEEILK